MNVGFSGGPPAAAGNASQMALGWAGRRLGGSCGVSCSVDCFQNSVLQALWAPFRDDALGVAGLRNFGRVLLVARRAQLSSGQLYGA